METAVKGLPHARSSRHPEEIKDAHPQEQKQRSDEPNASTIGLDAKTASGHDIATPPDTDNSPETLLQRLLMTTEKLAQKAELSRRKWQVAALVAISLTAVLISATIKTHIGSVSARTSQASLLLENHELTGKLEAAHTAIADLTRKVDLLTDQNIRLLSDNSKLKAQVAAPSPVPAQRTQAPVREVVADRSGNATPSAAKPVTVETRPDRPDQDRINAIRRGNYPRDMIRSELVAALGEPDRTYRMGRYEQLLYFDRAPGRFWFTNTQRLYAAR
jgi:hypothetical protein